MKFLKKFIVSTFLAHSSYEDEESFLSFLHGINTKFATSLKQYYYSFEDSKTLTEAGLLKLHNTFNIGDLASAFYNSGLKVHEVLESHMVSTEIKKYREIVMYYNKNKSHQSLESIKKIRTRIKEKLNEWGPQYNEKKIIR